MNTYRLVLLLACSILPAFIFAQSIPDTTGLPPAVTRYIADLSGIVTDLNVEKANAVAELEQLKKEKEAIQSASKAAADKAAADITRLEGVVDVQQDQIDGFKDGRAKDIGELERLRKDKATLQSELDDARQELNKLQQRFDRRADEAKAGKALKAEAEKVPGLEARLKTLETQVAGADRKLQQTQKQKASLEQLEARLKKERDGLQITLNETQQELINLKKECEAYAAKIREELAQLEKDVAAAVGGARFTATIVERQRLVSEAKRLKDIVSEQDVQRHQRVFAKVNQLFVFGKAWDTAKERLKIDYNATSIGAAVKNLERADTGGFSSGIVQEVKALTALLNGYCEEYARVKAFFDQINEANDPSITTSYIPRYLEGKYSVDPEYLFLRGKIEQRRANPSLTTQPFKVTTACKSGG